MISLVRPSRSHKMTTFFSAQIELPTLGPTASSFYRVCSVGIEFRNIKGYHSDNICIKRALHTEKYQDRSDEGSEHLNNTKTGRPSPMSNLFLQCGPSRVCQRRRAESPSQGLNSTDTEVPSDVIVLPPPNCAESPRSVPRNFIPSPDCR